MNDQIEQIFRREVGRCTATLIRVLGDIDLAEDAVAEAFLIAAERWPSEGVPPNPGGWITTTARNRAVDRLRREAKRPDRHLAAARLDQSKNSMTNDPDLADLDALAAVVPDDQLRLLFLCCHPALSPDAQTALTLRLLGGLTVAEIARSFLVTEATMTKRIARAKSKLRDNHASYRIPAARELPDRLHAALTAIYLIFTEGHTATSGPEPVRTDLTQEALRLTRVLAALMPDEPEVIGLLALILLTESRLPARTGPDETLIRLSEQDRSLWDRKLIGEGHQLVRACLRRNQPGPFQIQAAIAAVHADGANAAATDWSQVVALYDQLHTLRPTPVVALNRAIAVAERDGPVAALLTVESLREALADYQPFHAAIADLYQRAGHHAEAMKNYDQAIRLTANHAERDFLASQRSIAEAAVLDTTTSEAGESGAELRAGLGTRRDRR